jgi:UDP-glucose 4-epimerase
MSVMITGGMGVLGSLVTEGLVHRGEQPILYARHLDVSLMDPKIMKQTKYVRGDILDLPNLTHALKQHKVEKIIHMAALIFGDAQSNPYMGYKVNTEGTLNTLEAARIVGTIKRFVYTSSKAVYGAITSEFGHPTYRPMSEDAPKNPMLVYDATKLASEHLGFNYHRTFGIDFVALRFASTFGPGKLARHGPVSWHSKLIESAMLAKTGRLPQGGDQPDDMIYHRDIAQAIVRACFVDKLEHRVFNIGRGVPATMREFAEAVRRVIPGASLEIGSGLDYFGLGVPYYCIYDISRARQELGYEPEYDLERGVNDYVETMRRLKIEPQHVQ